MNPGRFGPGSFRPKSFRPGSFRPILGVGRFGLGRWVVSANLNTVKMVALKSYEKTQICYS